MPERSGPTSLPFPLTLWHLAHVAVVVNSVRPPARVPLPRGQLRDRGQRRLVLRRGRRKQRDGLLADVGVGVGHQRSTGGLAEIDGQCFLTHPGQHLVGGFLGTTDHSTNRFTTHRKWSLGVVDHRPQNRHGTRIRRIGQGPGQCRGIDLRLDRQPAVQQPPLPPWPTVSVPHRRPVARRHSAAPAATTLGNNRPGRSVRPG